MLRLSCLLLLALSAAAQTLDQPQPYRARRVSSFRENGANRDAKTVPPGESLTIADIRGAGRIVHTWVTLAIDDPDYLDNIWLRMYWDGASTPAVEAPFGDFHALGHGRVAPVNSSLVTVVARPELNLNLSNSNVAGFNTYFSMPYARGAKIVLENRSAQDAVAEAFDDLSALDQGLELEALNRPAVVFRDHCFLSNIDQTTRQIPRVGRFQGCIRQPFAGTVS